MAPSNAARPEHHYDDRPRVSRLAGEPDVSLIGQSLTNAQAPRPDQRIDRTGLVWPERILHNWSAGALRSLGIHPVGGADV
jgi:hypothetical protein